MSKNQSIENQFIDTLISKNKKLKRNHISRQRKSESDIHIRFFNGCGLDSADDFLSLLKEYNYQATPENTFSKKYKTGGYITWKGLKIGVLYSVAEQGSAERKKYSPENLGLASFETSSVVEFENKVIQGLISIGEKEIDLFKSLMNNIIRQEPIQDTKFLTTNKNIITSDFGEVLAALQDVVAGYGIRFCKSSNQKVVDYWRIKNNIEQGISVKNPKGGGKVTLSEFLNDIKHIVRSDPNNITVKILHAIGSHNRDELFKLAAEVCPQVKKIASIVGGLDYTSRLKYVESHDYDEFYDQIKNDSQFILNKHPLGIPDDQGWKNNTFTPRSLWAGGGKSSLEPLDFTLNTVINRFWGHLHVEEISDVVTKFLNKHRFKVVDIQNGSVYTNEVEFSAVKQWQTVYWSRATKAWHNWMAVEPVKEKG